jgi:hypothetical protein
MPELDELDRSATTAHLAILFLTVKNLHWVSERSKVNI